ncbi:MAG: hypothetical protein K9H48_21835 [Melioribacteraceae bacterium]|jgi:hypothetical protein|nr:hypothetical protein [Melioribacteraceae bacterium]MCF8358866.1 hypothetical protein [Prolixibacteraceae bacterium]
MNVIEKRDFIHNYLHRANEDFINEVYKKMLSVLKEDNPVVGYGENDEPINKSQFIADIKEAEAQIERGEYLTIDELEKESGQW